MLLAVDVGNTNVTVGIFDGVTDLPKATWRVATDIHRMPDEYGSLFLQLLEHGKLPAAQVKEVALCSVVPPLISTFQEMFRHYFGVTPLTIEAGVKTGVRIVMDNPKEVGPDRIVNAAAAHKLYPGPLVVVDLGTATTFDAVAANGDYIGGAITPGIVIATEALFARTARLPRVEMVRPERAIGRNTVSAIQSGVFFGYVGMLEGLISRIRREMEGNVTVIATGGYAATLASETSAIQIVNPDLTLIGLRLIHEMNMGQSI
jgi:type III pantothenate kinase